MNEREVLPTAPIKDTNRSRRGIVAVTKTETTKYFHYFDFNSFRSLYIGRGITYTKLIPSPF